MDKVPFKPKPGQIDFTNARYAPVLSCLVVNNGKILIVRRSRNSEYYPNCWAGITGFLDDKKTIREKVEEELQEELNINPAQITKIQVGPIFEYNDEKYQKTWISHPVLVEISTDKITLDWEASEYKWIAPRDVKNYAFGPGFTAVFKTFFPEI